MNIITYLPDFLNGLGITLVLTLASLAIGLLLAMAMTMGSYSHSTILKKAIAGFGFFIRGTPLLVQIYLIYFGAGQFEWIRDSFLWVVLRSPMACAIIALAINSACYTTVVLDGAIKSVPKNEIMACWSLGMSKWLAFRRIIFPRAMRIALPAYSNEVLLVLKATSLASTIALLDIMGITQQLINQTYATTELYLMAGVCYLLLNVVITLIFKRLMRHTQYRTA
jgi:His/Glu/Gln/Arg/opine family amino acid ABC transporter permease subunit